MRSIYLQSCFIILMLVSTVGFARVEYLNNARSIYNESERKCVLSLELYSKLNDSNLPFEDFFKDHLLLEDQVRVANCFEWGGDVESYYTFILDSYVGHDIVGELKQLAAETRSLGNLVMTTAFLNVAYRINTQLIDSSYNSYDLLVGLIDSALDARLFALASRLLNEELTYIENDIDKMNHAFRLASSYVLQKDYSNAEVAYSSIFLLDSSIMNNMEFASLHLRVAQMASRQSAWDRSEYHIFKAVEIADLSPSLLDGVNNLRATNFISQSKYEEALPLVEVGISHHQSIQQENGVLSPGRSVVILERQLQLANIFRGLQRFNEAAQLYDSIAETRRRMFGIKSMPYAEVMEEKIKLLYRQGDYYTADQLIVELIGKGVPLFLLSNI